MERERESGPAARVYTRVHASLLELPVKNSTTTIPLRQAKGGLLTCHPYRSDNAQLRAYLIKALSVWDYGGKTESKRGTVKHVAVVASPMSPRNQIPPRLLLLAFPLLSPDGSKL